MATGRVSIRMRPGIVAVCGAALIVTLGAAVVYTSLIVAGQRPVTPPTFVVADALAVVVVIACALVVSARGLERPARWLAAFALGLTGYVAAVAAGFSLAPRGDWAARFAVSIEGGWWVIVLTMGALVALVAVDQLVGRTRSTRMWSTAIITLAAVSVLLGLGVIDPSQVYPGLAAPLADTALATPPAAIVYYVVTVSWMLSCAAAPILAWRTAARAPRSDTLRKRERLTVVAIASSCPLLTLVTCWLMLPVVTSGLIAEELATLVLSLVFCVPAAVFAAGIAAALATSSGDAAVALRIAIRWVLTGLWFLVGLQLAIIAGSLLAVNSGSAGILGASAVAVALAVCFVAAYMPVSRWVLQFTGLDAPEPTAADRLTDVLSPREREVLALLAEGHSNVAIAAALYVSERTVDSHVTAIFSKLELDRSSDVNRRVQAAAAWHAAQPGAPAAPIGAGENSR